ncbi:MAG: TonB-dependent receptor [Planctomycetes bacterium]|nr:TonB-dependent receptor [Planctomycetota bacterium]
MGETVVVAPRSKPTLTTSRADVIVVTGEALERTGERNLPRAIAKAAGTGVWMQETNTGGGSPVVRGLIGPHVLILVDGVRLNDSSTRLGPNQSLNTIDPAHVERVEVVKGPSSVLYGSDAVGGTILVWTKRRKPGSASATGALGAFGVELEGSAESATEGGRGSLGVSWANDTDGAIAIGSLAEWDDLRTGGGEVDFTGYHSTGFFSSWEHAFGSKRSLRAILRIHRDFDVPRTDRLIAGYGQTQPSNSEFDFKVQENTGYTLVYEDQEAGPFADRIQARFFLRRYVEERQIRNTGSNNRRLEQDDVQGFGVGVDVVKDLGGGHRLTWGVDFERDDVDSDRTDTNVVTSAQTAQPGSFAPNAHYASAGVFAQDEIRDVAGFDVTVGARYSYYDFSFNQITSSPSGGPEQEGDFDALTASVQAARSLSSSTRVVATVAQGFRAPHLDDLARNSTVFGGTELANPDLDPEKSLTGEIALEYTSNPWRATVAVYHSTLSDYIGRVLVDAGDPGTTGDETYLRENVGTVEFMGVEAEVRRSLGADSPWSVGGGVTWTRGRQYDDTINPATGTADFDDVPARRIPPLFGRASLTYDALDEDPVVQWGELALLMASEQDDLHPEDLSDPRIDPDGTAGWAALNADVGGPLGASGASSWSFGVHNVLDKEYRVHGSGVDAPGINAVVGLRWSF